MPKKIILILLWLVFLSGFHLAQAGVVINEVQLNPVVERFIELYNSGNSAIDLTGWYIQRKTETGNDFSSLVSKTYFEGKIIEANGHFLVSKDALGLNSFTLTNSNTIQLKNSDQKVEDKVGWGNAESRVADNPPDGKSIQRINNEWIINSPTPDADNLSSSINDSGNLENNTEDNNFSTQNITETKNKISETPTIKIKILTNTLAFSGQPFEIKANVFGLSNENIVLGKVYWNFGDGISLEQINNFEKIQHTYYYPGEYVIYSEYYSNVLSKIPDAINKIIVKVVPITVTISKVGDAKDFFIELSNNASSDIDVSSWIIKANEKVFTLPKNSFIMSKNKMTISSRISGFVFSDRYSLELISSTGELIFKYSSFNKTSGVSTRDYSTINKLDINSRDKNLLKNNEEVKIPLDNLPAEVIKNDLSVNNLIYGTSLFIFLGVGASMAYIIRSRSRKSISQITENDFKILDE